MVRKLNGVLALAIISVFLLATPLAAATPVFSDNFASSQFVNWTKTFIDSGSSQTISNNIAHFTVPTPNGVNASYSYILKDGFTSTINSTITASEDVYVTKVPSGYPQGEGGIFFFYVCDSSDLGGNLGNFGVGIDGSDAWSIWIGGNSIYSYVFQTSGDAPVSNMWYHIVLTIDNPSASVTLAANGTAVINVPQQQFTDKTHPISLMTGMGEDWYCQSSGTQEVDVANVNLDISDAPIPTSTPEPTTPTTPSQTSSFTSTPNLAPAPTQTTKNTPASTPKPTPSPTTSDPLPTTSPTIKQTTQPTNHSTPPQFLIWTVSLVTIIAVASFAVIVKLRKR